MRPVASNTMASIGGAFASALVADCGGIAGRMAATGDSDAVGGGALVSAGIGAAGIDVGAALDGARGTVGAGATGGSGMAAVLVTGRD